VLYVPGADPDDASGDPSYLVLAKPNVIMNDIRLRGLGVAGSTPPVARHSAITRKPFGTLDGHPGMPQEVPG
jgi:hypothetical protein